MKFPINLASQPFRRDRAIFVASAAVSVLLVLTLGVLVFLALEDRQQLAGVRQEVNRLNRQIRTQTAEQARLDSILRQPQNTSVLELSVFINTLIYHKALSWSRLFEDLEKTLPYNVKVLQLHPVLDARNRVTLDMMIGANSAGPLFDAIRAMEKSPAFGTVRLGSTLPKTQAEPLTRVRFSVNYAQKL